MILSPETPKMFDKRWGEVYHNSRCSYENYWPYVDISYLSFFLSVGEPNATRG